jgi:hypothetical protein
MDSSTDKILGFGEGEGAIGWDESGSSCTDVGR